MSKVKQKPLVGLLSRLGSWQDGVSVLFLFLVLEVAILSIERAGWLTPQPSLTMVLVLAVLAAFLLNRSRLSVVLAHVIAILVGGIITVWQASGLVSGESLLGRIKELVTVLQSWWQATGQGETGQGTVHFAVFLIFFVWLAGYFSAWYVLRKRNAWVGICLGAIALLVNLSNLPAAYYSYFFGFLVLSLLLIAITNLSKQQQLFRRGNVRYPKRGIAYFAISAISITVLVTSLIWRIPEIRVYEVETLTGEKMPLKENVEQYLTRLLSAVPAKQNTLKSGEQEVLFLGEPFEQADKLQFIIATKQPYYWRTRSFDLYTSRGWASSNLTPYAIGPGASITEDKQSPNRRRITYTVLTLLKTDILLTAGEFITADRPVNVLTLRPSPEISTPIEELTATELEQIKNKTGETVAVIAPYFFRPTQRYSVVSSVVTASEADLSRAGTNYPEDITKHYLQLPSTITERTRHLVASVTRAAKSPWDKAMAIKHFLSRFDYSLQVKPPPPGVDGVDYFLFSEQSGNCVYFATAAVVMLRLEGVPTRLAIGYMPGDLDPETGRYGISARTYHAWPEVYLPGYGWVDFDPTPAGEAGAAGGESHSSAETIEGLWDLPPDLSFEDPMLFLDPGMDGSVGPSPAGREFPLSGTLLGILSAFALTFIIMTRIALHRWPWQVHGIDRASDFYSRVCFLATLARLRPRPQQTPLEYSTSLALALPLHTEALNNIVQAYIQRRFSWGKWLDIEQERRLKESWRKLYPALIKRIFHVSAPGR